MERRDFIKQSGIFTAGLALTPDLSLLKGKQPFVVIIGAGFAGLSAAYQLKKKNIRFMILEARNRVGGRVFPPGMDDAENPTVELRAEWIGNSHPKIQDLCTEFGLKTLNHQFDTRLILNDEFFDNGNWSFSEAMERYEKIRKEFPGWDPKETAKMDELDWWRYLDKIGLTERDIEIKELLDSTDFGETIRNVSAFAAMGEYAFSSEKNEMDQWIEGGNHQLIKKLYEHAGLENVKLSHPVERIAQTRGKVVVNCKNGFTIECDKLICTIPNYAVTKINWEPGLPADKMHAINQLQYARIIKSSILFKERFWKDEAFDMITDTVGHYFYHSTKLQPGVKGVLTSYTVGDKAQMVSKMNQEQKIKNICEALRPAFGDVSRYTDKLVSYYWGSDVHTQGAYAIYDTHQWFNLRPVLQEKFQNIHFAGEHLADWQGFMEGAIETGFAAAEKVAG